MQFQLSSSIEAIRVRSTPGVSVWVSDLNRLTTNSTEIQRQASKYVLLRKIGTCRSVNKINNNQEKANTEDF